MMIDGYNRLILNGPKTVEPVRPHVDSVRNKPCSCGSVKKTKRCKCVVPPKPDFVTTDGVVSDRGADVIGG